MCVCVHTPIAVTAQFMRLTCSHNHSTLRHEGRHHARESNFASALFAQPAERKVQSNALIDVVFLLGPLSRSTCERNKFRAAILSVIILANQPGRREEKTKWLTHDEGCAKFSARNETRAENWTTDVPFVLTSAGIPLCFKPGNILRGSVSLNHCEKRPFRIKDINGSKFADVKVVGCLIFWRVAGSRACVSECMNVTAGSRVCARARMCVYA